MKQNSHIYFDHNATTVAHPMVREAMMEVLSSPYNPSSVHVFGRRGKSILEESRKKIALMLNLNNEYEVVFTSGGTEANNLALRGMIDYRVLTPATEHSSILRLVSEALLKVDSNGIVDLMHLDRVLRALEGQKIIVSIMMANNETGVLQPIEEIAEIVHRRGALLHSDCCQVAGRVPLDIRKLNLDLATISGHKFLGPTGIGALIFKKQLPLKPILLGGGQEFRLRPGTHNLAGIAGMGKAAEIAPTFYDDFKQLALLRDYIESAIAADGYVFGKNAPRLPNTTNISMAGVASETQVIFFDTNGLAVSAGSACMSGRTDLPHVQMAMGASEDTAKNVIRVSLGIENTKEEVEKFISLWRELNNKGNKHVA